MEKKEQEVTARNAQIHQQKIGCMQDFSVAGNSEDRPESDTAGWHDELVVLICFISCSFAVPLLIHLGL